MSFDIDLQKAIGKATAAIEAVPIKITFELHNEIVRRSPVDTGRYRANNQVTLNTPPQKVIDMVDSSQQGSPPTLTQSSEVSAATNRYKPGDTIFLTNNLEYAQYIEFGDASKQAIGGVYRLAAQTVMSHIAKVFGGIK